MAETVLGAVGAVLREALAQPLAPGLYLVATPIGNLSDISLRALSVLARVDTIYCEDTRQTQKLLSRYGIHARLRPYHDHNAERERPKLLQALAGGASLALVSDAGTPLVSDPGYKLVREAAEQELAVTCIPGASAVLTGLAVSALPTDSFFFAGFLPPREGAARTRLSELAGIPGTLIFFESASRLNRVLGLMAEAFPGREIVLARELTKRFEEIIRTRLPLHETLRKEWKGEFVLLVSPPFEETPEETEIVAVLSEALERISLRDAVEEVRRTLHVPRKQVYDLALKIQKNAQQDHDDENA